MAEALEEPEGGGAAAAANLLNSVDALGYNAMHHACYRKNIATAEWLLQQPGLDLESRTTDLQHKLGATSLHLAVTTGSMKLVKLMLETGIDVTRDLRFAMNHAIPPFRTGHERGAATPKEALQQAAERV